MKLRNFERERQIFIHRAMCASVLVFSCFGLLIVNLYRLQIKQYAYYQTRANANDIKMLPLAPSRGLIFDRNGVPLVQNVTHYALQLLPYKIGNIKKTLQRLQTDINLSPQDIAEFHQRLVRSSKYHPIQLKSQLTEKEVARFSVDQYQFSGVSIESYQDRYYPYGAALAHVVGYVSKINDHDYQRLNQEGKAQNYAANHNIGKQGLEEYYESELHGKTGYQEVEVDNHGRIVRVLKMVPPVAGKNIWLTLDLSLQLYIEQQLQGQRAAVIVEDPATSGVLAMVSSPAYDPNPFVRGINYNEYHRLLQDKNLPLINRATQGLYPPASTVKPYIAISALQAGVISPQTEFFGASSWTLPGTNRRYRDWKKTGHGMLDVTRAIEESADTFFYQVAYRLGIDRIHTLLSQFGYGKLTGIDLHEEYPGLLPSRSWKRRVHHKDWYQGDTISVGIGQGYWVATPMQMEKALVTLINSGQVNTPHLLEKFQKGQQVESWKPQQPNRQIARPDSPDWALVRKAMYGMANMPNGTGYRYFHSAPYGIAAKSGTSQVFSLGKDQKYHAELIPVRLRDHIFYTAFAPFQHPKVAVTLILENGGDEGVTAAPVMRHILDHILLADPKSGSASSSDTASVSMPRVAQTGENHWEWQKQRQTGQPQGLLAPLIAAKSSE